MWVHFYTLGALFMPAIWWLWSYEFISDGWWNVVNKSKVAIRVNKSKARYIIRCQLLHGYLSLESYFTWDAGRQKIEHSWNSRFFFALFGLYIIPFHCFNDEYFIVQEGRVIRRMKLILWMCPCGNGKFGITIYTVNIPIAHYIDLIM